MNPFSRLLTLCLGILLFVLSSSAFASGATIFTFEDLPDAYFFSGGDQNIGEYYGGINFGPDVTALSASRFGGYDNLGFPPDSGDVVIWDADDSTIIVSFASPLDYFGIWYTSFDPLTLNGFDSGSNLLESTIGIPNTDGTTGSTSFIFLSNVGISSVALTSTAGYFTLDDMTIDAPSGTIPEPSSSSFFTLGLFALYYAVYRTRRKQRPGSWHRNSGSPTAVKEMGI